jgi:hypothetical protein
MNGQGHYRDCCKECGNPLEGLTEEVMLCRNPGCDMNPYLSADAKRIIAERKQRHETEAREMALRMTQTYRRY